MNGDATDPGGTDPGEEIHGEVDLGDDEEVHGDRRWRAAAFRQLPFFVQVFAGPEHLNVAETDAVASLYGQRNVGQRIAHYLTGAQGQGIVEMLDRAYAGERITARAVRFGVVTSGGTEREVFGDMDFLPLRDAAGEIVGTIAWGRDVTEEVRAEREQAAAAAELSRRYRRATDLIEEVQRALLPSRLPVLPAVEIAASYVVGGAEQVAGGDWFDVLERPGRAVAAVVGDVVGHGVAASAVMSQLRAVALERLHAGAEPAEVVAALDRFVDVVPAGRSATVCVLVLEPGSGAVRYCSAGHPPPLVVDGSGGSRYLDPVPAAPVGHAADRRTTSAALGAGELVLLYTDGLLERPGVPASSGTVELARTAADAAADRLMPVFTLPSAVDRVTVQTLERLTRVTGSNDDITLLALRPTAPLPDLRLVVEARRDEAAVVRAALRRWLGPERVAAAASDQLDQIVTELCDNVVEHAYADGAGPLAVDAALDERGRVTLTVADHGRWRAKEGPATGRGLGLAIVQEFAEHVQVERTDEGTAVTVRFRPWKHPQGARPRAPHGAPQLFDAYSEDRGDSSILTVRGPVDVACVPQLDGDLALRVTPGSPPLSVDLEAVTVLSSAAIHAIRRRMDQAEAAGVAVRLVSSPGTVAQQVLALVGMETGTRAR